LYLQILQVIHWNLTLSFIVKIPSYVIEIPAPSSREETNSKSHVSN
jgi:hypothetical protein